MASKFDRLRDIVYQVIKGVSLTDEQKVSAIRSIYDAAIAEGDVIPEEMVFKTSGLGVTIAWSSDKKTVTLRYNSVVLEDNLSDNIIPPLEGYSNYFMVNEDLLYVNGEYLTVSAQ